MELMDYSLEDFTRKVIDCCCCKLQHFYNIHNNSDSIFIEAYWKISKSCSGKNATLILESGWRKGWGGSEGEEQQIFPTLYYVNKFEIRPVSTDARIY